MMEIHKMNYNYLIVGSGLYGATIAQNAQM
mgnify:FL=1